MRSACVIGLGKLGAPLAACLAGKGLRVVGVDTDARKVEAINNGQPPVFEPGLDKMLARAEGRLTATHDISKGVAHADVTFIIVPTPSESSGDFSLQYVMPACQAIGEALAKKKDYHLVVLTSTVMPGTTGGAARGALETASGKKCGRDFGLCYSPEFIALGTTIRDFLNPDFLLIGECDRRAGDLLESIYLSVCENSPAVARMNFVNAEITKLAVNTYLTTKISFANMLARVAERVPEADVEVITAALGLDSRIGPKYLKGAISYGGPCFPRDNHALAALARQVGAPADLPQMIDRFNRAQIHWLADLVAHHLPPGNTAGILGLTYKPGTDVVEEAVGLLLALELAERRLAVVIFDPAGHGHAARALSGKVRFAADAKECISQSEVVVLATPWPEFRNLPPDDWARAERPRVVIDCWRAMKSLASHPGVRYITLGTGAPGTSC